MDRESRDIQAIADEHEQAIVSAIASCLKDHDFRKKRSTWYKKTDEVVLVLNLQRSAWGKSFYINLAALIRGISDIKDPPEYQCHIQKRLTLPGLEQALTLQDSKLSPKQRQQIVFDAINDEALPILTSWQSLESLREALRVDPKLSNSMSLVAKNWLASSDV